VHTRSRASDGAADVAIGSVQGQAGAVGPRGPMGSRGHRRDPLRCIRSAFGRETPRRAPRAICVHRSLSSSRLLAPSSLLRFGEQTFRIVRCQVPQCGIRKRYRKEERDSERDSVSFDRGTSFPSSRDLFTCVTRIDDDDLQERSSECSPGNIIARTISSSQAIQL